MDPADRLHRLRDALLPPSGTQERVKARMHARIGESPVFSQIRSALNPSPRTAAQVWLHIRRSMGLQPAVGILSKLRRFLEPDASVRFILRERILQRLEPQSTSFADSLWQWSAAVAAVALIIRMGPMLLTNTSLTPRTSAQAEVVVMPTEGETYMLQAEFGIPLDPETGMRLEQPATFHVDGQATFAFPNLGLVRAKNATVTVWDTSAELQADAETTMEFDGNEGSLWVQGLLPSYLRGIRIAVGNDVSVEVHEGSVSITKTGNGDIDIQVWSRSAKVIRSGENIVLVTGEALTVRDGETMVARRASTNAAEDPWVKQNIARDSVRRKEVAQLQLERRVANAGILPNSPLFVLKQAAEAVDSALTFDEQTRLEKQLAYAENRLNEAAALLSEGEDDAADSALEEYKRTLLAVASSTGSDLVRSLLHQEVAESTADVAAALPDDEAYVLKETVLQASAELPDGFVDARRVEGVLLLDTLSALNQAVTDGDLAAASVTFTELEPYLSALKAEQRALPPDVRKDAMASLSVIASDLVSMAGEGNVPELLLAQVEPFAPLPEPVDTPAVLFSFDEAQRMAKNILTDLEEFTTVHALENTIRDAIRDLAQEPRLNDELVLRNLYALLERGEGDFDDEQRGILKEEVREGLRQMRAQ